MLRCKTDGQTLLEVLEFRNCLEIECFLPLKQWAKCGVDFWQILEEQLWLACAVCWMGFERPKKAACKWFTGRFWVMRYD